MGKYVEAVVEAMTNVKYSVNGERIAGPFFHVRVPSLHGPYDDSIKLVYMKGHRLDTLSLPMASTTNSSIAKEIFELANLQMDPDTVSSSEDLTRVFSGSDRALPIVYVEFLNNDLAHPIIVGCSGKVLTSSKIRPSVDYTGITYNESGGYKQATYSTSASSSATGITWYWPVIDTAASIERPHCSRGYRGPGNHEGLDIIYGWESRPTIYAAADGVVGDVWTGCINENSLDSNMVVVHDCKTAGCNPGAGFWQYKGKPLCNGAYGNIVYINHANGYVSAYAHLMPNSILVSKGQTITAGTPIARMGTTGASQGVHLHFEIRRNGERLNTNPGVIFNYNLLEVN